MGATKLRRVQSSTAWGGLARIAVYTFVLFLLQAQWASRMYYPAMRVDLLLPLMFGIALTQPPIACLSWAFAWGFVLDVFSGKFWGFHVVSYVITACTVYLGSQKMELHNPLYQMIFMGLCALGQSAVLGLFLWAEPSTSYLLSPSIWISLGMRSALMLLLCPLIIYPIRRNRKSSF
jgi:rod shape-determining protein MreD